MKISLFCKRYFLFNIICIKILLIVISYTSNSLKNVRLHLKIFSWQCNFHMFLATLFRVGFFIGLLYTCILGQLNFQKKKTKKKQKKQEYSRLKSSIFLFIEYSNSLQESLLVISKN